MSRPPPTAITLEHYTIKSHPNYNRYHCGCDLLYSTKNLYQQITVSSLGSNNLSQATPLLLVNPSIGHSTVYVFRNYSYIGATIYLEINGVTVNIKVNIPFGFVCYVTIDRTELGSTVIITGVNTTFTEDRTKKIRIVGIGRYIPFRHLI